METYGDFMKYIFFIFILSTLNACATSNNQSVYEKLGGEKKIAEIVDNFINEISFDENIFKHFEESHVDRFREKLIEQLCVETGGPCTYSGDSMAEVHAKMNVTESEFNRTVDLLVSAMKTAAVPHRLQNKILARLAPMRGDIIYK